MGIKRILKILRYKLYNLKNNTKIKSIKASLKAKYGKDVLISDNTIVSSDVEIGDYSYVNINSSIEKCIIGKFCSISSGVFICPYEHPLYPRTTHPFIEKYLSDIRKPVIIGNDVLISLNAIILSGVRIGNGAVIAAGAVVTHDVAPYEIVGGVPAKHIKWRFPKEEIEKLETIKWWDFDLDILNRNKSYFLLETDYFNPDN